MHVLRHHENSWLLRCLMGPREHGARISDGRGPVKRCAVVDDRQPGVRADAVGPQLTRMMCQHALQRARPVCTTMTGPVVGTMWRAWSHGTCARGVRRSDAAGTTHHPSCHPFDLPCPAGMPCRATLPTLDPPAAPPSRRTSDAREEAIKETESGYEQQDGRRAPSRRHALQLNPSPPEWYHGQRQATTCSAGGRACPRRNWPKFKVFVVLVDCVHCIVSPIVHYNVL